MPAEVIEILFCGWDGPPPVRHAVAPEALPTGIAMTVFTGKVTALCGAQIDGHGFKRYPFRGASDEEQDGMECVSCRLLADGSDPELVAARARALAGLREVRQAVEVMLERVSPVLSHDEVAEVIMLVSQLGDLFRDVKPRMEMSIIEWLLQNEDGVRSVRVGEMKYWGEKEKSVRCLDVGEAGAAAAAALHADDLAEIVYGDEDGVRAILGVVKRLFQEVVSSNGLKEAATRTALADAAERGLRSASSADPSVVAVADGQTPAEALELAVEMARELAVARLFEESWPNKIKGGEPRTKLGVANLRFVHRVGGGSKKLLEEMERERLAQGGV